MSRTFAALQKALPQHPLSRLTGAAARSTRPWLKNTFIESFAAFYGVDLSEAELEDPRAYESFNAFFTRALKPGARPLPEDPQALVSPADGALSQCGVIERGKLLQAKGHSYSLESLIGEPCEDFQGGTFLTVYLAPRDYHRVHAPLAGELVKTRAVPGELLSVNASTEAAIPGLFARNERLVCEFATSQGRAFVVLVGALIVASIETVWEGPQSPYRDEVVSGYGGEHYHFERGAELGRFLLGSTVIVCLQRNQLTLREKLAPGTSVRMGEPLGTLS